MVESLVFNPELSLESQIPLIKKVITGNEKKLIYTSEQSKKIVAKLKEINDVIEEFFKLAEESFK